MIAAPRLVRAPATVQHALTDNLQCGFLFGASSLKPRDKSRAATNRDDAAAAGASPLRIIGGRYARRRLVYTGDPRTRPMKDRVREAVFNLLGPTVVGKHAIDLFAGTGALGLEALSRGAVQATFIEQHFPTAAVIRKNIAALEIRQGTEVCPANVFIWARRFQASSRIPWVVFCSPPYDFYVSRAAEVAELLGRLITAAPAESIFVVEADKRFDFGTLPDPQNWDIREYPPARVGLLKMGAQ